METGSDPALGAPVAQPRMVMLVRVLHGLITSFFVTCITYIYYAGLTDRVGLWAYLAVAAVILEGVVVGLNGGNCPLGAVHHRYGDDKAFFDLILPARLAKRAVPVLGLVATGGMLTLFW